MRAAPALLLALLIGSFGVAACGNEPGPEPGSYAGDPSLTPEQVVRAYVQALDERDGQRFCSLVAPYIAGRYDLATRDPDSLLREMDGCPDVAKAFIGYVEDCCPDVFKHARLQRITGVEREGDLMRVGARIRLDLDQMGAAGGPHVKTIHDVVWLARFDGAWRLARLSAVATAAALGPARFEDEAAPAYDEDTAAKPDVAAEQRAFATQVDRARGRAEDRRESYDTPAAAADCSGGASVQDPPTTTVTDSSGDSRPVGEGPGDIMSMDVAVRGDSVCVRWRLGGRPAGPLFLSYSHRWPGFGAPDQHFAVELRDDGSTRVTSGEDDDGRPIVVPADVGVTGDSVSVMLSPESFSKGQREWGRPQPPALEGFGFSAGVSAATGDDQRVEDWLGETSSDTFRYPDGSECPEPDC